MMNREDGQDCLGGDFSAVSMELAKFIMSTSLTYACGGTIPIKGEFHVDTAQRRSKRLGKNDKTPDKVDDSKDATKPDDAKRADEIDNTEYKDDIPSTPPITLRWDSPGGRVSKVTIPLWIQGSDVQDKKYRNTAKMFRSAFSSDFCPYEFGIIDTLTQALLPTTKEGAPTTKGVRAELYALNIYSAPSGIFKSHVDTPRSDVQFGSLVISLAYHHEGGQLVVRHVGHSITYDWGTSAAGETDAVHWAAFYSDCEHEVREVSHGHPVTPTYNLYYAPGRVLTDATFMPRGDVLGVCCLHGYAHSSRSAGKALPAVLKGFDMAVYAVFRAQGLDVQVHPVADRVVDDLEFDRDPKYQPDSPRFNTRAGTLGQLEASDVGGNDGDTWDDIWADWSHDRLDSRSAGRALLFINEAKKASRHTTAAATITFFETASAQQLYNLSNSGPGFFIRGHHIKTTQHGRPSRVVTISGPREVLDLPSLFNDFEQRFNFHIDGIEPLDRQRTTQDAYEIRFASFYCQAEMAVISINRDTNFRDIGVQILYSRDPCEPPIPTASITQLATSWPATPQPATLQHVNVTKG
ncbi:hypothetical protein B0T18DRAFT_442245 [Schizothecium vesticola]|uniref:Fe2OG dioxygenase domain-containing protein n=1 Tax=Schizothecium vesticola TaxID=314040 RepID=A0AA40F9H8_9PEZI|nr:hypothetical protein B0T18DRAFT_442245 [Schizothecium vesticola]